MKEKGKHYAVADTRIYVAEKGEGYPVFVLHGGSGSDHHSWGNSLDSLCDEFKLLLLDLRGHGLSDEVPEDTLTLKQMAKDVALLAKAMNIKKYAVLGHSFGSFVALQHAVDFPGKASQTIVSGCIPSAHYLYDSLEKYFKTIEPKELREQIIWSWEFEKEVQTVEEFEKMSKAQCPWHFKDLNDPRINRGPKNPDAILKPDIMRYFANHEYGGIEVEDRLHLVTQPTLVLVGKYDRTCPLEAAQSIADGIPNSTLVVFENCGHLTRIEDNEAFTKTIRDFLNKHRS